ncbi:hypothetical protein LCGC14_1062830 [marine sediment metagenome]|uniref:Uncharacterized protein n=1 Tax=marine sediment metagenome TaxID=412755 RepID=A0A0F9MKL7_9ZZZZ
MRNEICEFCGADKEVYRETLGEECGCTETNMGNQGVFRILNLLRRNGIPCFQADGVTTQELDDEVKGWG